MIVWIISLVFLFPAYSEGGETLNIFQRCSFKNNVAADSGASGGKCGGAFYADSNNDMVMFFDCGDITADGNKCASTNQDFVKGNTFDGYSGFVCTNTCATTELPNQCDCKPAPDCGGGSGLPVFIQPSSLRLRTAAGRQVALRYKVENPNGFPIAGQTLTITAPNDVTIVSAHARGIG